MSGPAVVAALAALADALRQDIREEVRAELDAGASRCADADSAHSVQWASQVEAGTVAGVAPQTIRQWQARGLLSRGRRGRVNLAELRAFLAAREARPIEPSPARDADAARRERARRAAAEIAASLGMGQTAVGT